MNPVAGWKSRTREWLDVHRCPGCRHSTDQIGGDDEGFFCPDCGGKFALDEWVA